MTPNYRTLPVEVEAFQFDPSGAHRLKLPEGVRGFPSPSADNWAYSGCKFSVDTIFGSQPIQPGDWIVTTGDGNWRAVSKKVFESGFEPVKNDGQTTAKKIARALADKFIERGQMG